MDISRVLKRGCGVTVVIGVLLVSGCSGGDPVPTSLEQKTSEATADPSESAEKTATAAVSESAAYQAAIADGKATEEEYLAGFKRYQSCLSAAGYELKDPYQEGALMKFMVPDAAVGSGADAKCYKSEFEMLDAMWQGQNFTDYSEEIGYLAACLIEVGKDPGVAADASDEATYDRLQKLYDEADLFGKCNQ